MIPQHLIDKAVRAQIIAEGRDPDDRCEQWKFGSYDHDVRTVLEAVAADIWEEGAESGWQATGEGWNGEYANGTTHDGAQSFRDAGNDTPNPYRASETA